MWIWRLGGAKEEEYSKEVKNETCFQIDQVIKRSIILIFFARAAVCAWGRNSFSKHKFVARVGIVRNIFRIFSSFLAVGGCALHDGGDW